MTYVERWLLPDGVEEILPDCAERIEKLRRDVLDLYHGWGYDLVIPPLVEFTESLLTGSGKDVDLLTFKVVDQLTGRTMGIRADMTPQVARMDAHSFVREGINRLCYAGHVLYTRPKSPLATRSPIQAGIELFGEPGLDADIEVMSLLVETLQLAQLPQVHIDLGHVGIFTALSDLAGLDEGQQAELFDLFQRKATAEITAWVSTSVGDQAIAKALLTLPKLAGDHSVLDKARSAFAGLDDEILVAIDELEAAAQAIQGRYPQTELYFDLSEVRGYHYHTGIVFAAFAQGYGHALANGGRYDHIGEVFGRSRAATGFAVDLTALVGLVPTSAKTKGAIFVPASDNPRVWQAVKTLRDQGERVLMGMSGQKVKDVGNTCDRQLVLAEDQYRVEILGQE